MNAEDLDAFMSRVRDWDGGCWRWVGDGTSNGYGRFHRPGRRPRLAHRVAYEHFVGPIPEGLCLDHLCRMRRCVNPEHLEPVTLRENILRGVSPSARAAIATHCPHGHPYDETNTYTEAGTGFRRCRTCRRGYFRQYRRDQRRRQRGDLNVEAVS